MEWLSIVKKACKKIEDIIFVISLEKLARECDISLFSSVRFQCKNRLHAERVHKKQEIISCKFKDIKRREVHRYSF